MVLGKEGEVKPSVVILGKLEDWVTGGFQILQSFPPCGSSRDRMFDSYGLASLLSPGPAATWLARDDGICSPRPLGQREGEGGLLVNTSGITTHTLLPRAGWQREFFPSLLP